ncbi:MAG: LytTR family DNA-binding domain-containing protein [Bacteroidaceae bacterium]
MYRCIIIDDEEPARLLLNDYCQNVDDLEVVALLKSALPAMKYIERGEVDILFIDINMPVISGVDFVKSLSKPPQIIFTTAYREYAVEGFELEVADYLLKPIEFSRFLKAISKVRRAIESECSSSFSPFLSPYPSPTDSVVKPPITHVQLKTNKKIYKIDFSDILYVQSQNEYLKYYTKSNGNLLVYGTMKSAEEMLSNGSFYRIHRSYIVNDSAIKYIEGNRIVLKDGQKLPLGENYKTEFLAHWL